MYCNRCGQLVPRGSKFCRHCGARLDVPGAATMLPDDFYMPQPQRETQKAKEIFNQALEAFENGDLNKAISLCKEAVKHDPDYAPIHSLLGMLYERVGDKKAAYAEYEIALRLNPNGAADRDALKRLRKELGLPNGEPIQHAAPMHIRSLPLIAVTTFAIALMFFVRAVHKPKPSEIKMSTSSIPTSIHPSTEQQPSTQQEQQVQRILVDAINAKQRGDYNEALKMLYQAKSLSPNDERIRKLIDEVESERTRVALTQGSQAQTDQPTQLPSTRRQVGSSLPVLPPPSLQEGSEQRASQHREQPSSQHARLYAQPPQPPQSTQQPQLWQSQQPPQGFVMPQPAQPFYYQPLYSVRPPMMPQPQPQQFVQQPQQPQQGGEVGGGRIVVRVGERKEDTQRESTQPPPKEEKRQEPQQVVASQQLSVDDLERQAIEMHYAGKLNSAISLYLQALELNRDIAREGRLRQNLADAYRQSNRLREAAREYRRAIEAYQRQLKQGVGDPTEIEIAIRACKQGLELCK
jgi:tetratricopeptide (TPR) repeat protein